jgi:putative membrane protein
MEENPQQRLAYDRTLLANERTFAAWLRTGLSISGIGLAIAKLFYSQQQIWAPMVLGALFVLMGVGVVLFGAMRYARVAQDMSGLGSSKALATNTSIYVLALLVSLLLLGGLVLIIPGLST